MGLLTWHGGLSGSAPLSMTTTTGAEKVLPTAYVSEVGSIPLEATILSPMNLVVSLGLLVIVPAFLALLAPAREKDLQPAENFQPLVEKRFTPPDEEGLPRLLNTSWIIAWVLGLLLLLGVGRYMWVNGFGSIGLDQVIMIMFALGLLLHASPVAYMHAATDAARGCAGIIVQFPIYAGIMAVMSATGLVTMISEGFVSIGNETTMPFLSFIAAGIVNIFVPSGGGQWAIQGPIALQSGMGGHRRQRHLDAGQELFACESLRLRALTADPHGDALRDERGHERRIGVFYPVEARGVALCLQKAGKGIAVDDECDGHILIARTRCCMHVEEARRRDQPAV